MTAYECSIADIIAKNSFLADNYLCVQRLNELYSSKIEVVSPFLFFPDLDNYSGLITCTCKSGIISSAIIYDWLKFGLFLKNNNVWICIELGKTLCGEFDYLLTQGTSKKQRHRQLYPIYFSFAVFNVFLNYKLNFANPID